jgi:hypothetical protein
MKGKGTMSSCLRGLRFGLFLSFACLNLQAQEFAISGGSMQAIDVRQSSYSWQIDYRQDFYRNLAASITYINEGHVPGHHRDGYAVQAWGRIPFGDNRYSVSLGLGTYSFFDTQHLAAGGSQNVHVTGPIISAAASAFVSDRWFVRAGVSHIIPTHEMKVSTAVIGMGYWFGQNDKPTPGELGHAADEQASVTANELTLFVGQSVVNTFFSQSARAYALEYRRGFVKHVDWTLAFIYEGNPEIVRRSGLATQAWVVNNFFEDHLSVGIGLGPYVYIDQRHPAGAGRINPAATTPLASLTIAGRLSREWYLRLLVDRVASSYNRDADIFLLGLGYRR